MVGLPNAAFSCPGMPPGLRPRHRMHTMPMTCQRLTFRHQAHRPACSPRVPKERQVGPATRPAEAGQSVHNLWADPRMPRLRAACLVQPLQLVKIPLPGASAGKDSLPNAGRKPSVASRPKSRPDLFGRGARGRHGSGDQRLRLSENLPRSTLSKRLSSPLVLISRSSAE